MKKKIVLVGAGSTSFGPSTFSDLYLSDILEGSTVFLHDINKEKLDIIFELLTIENERLGDKFILERSTNRAYAFKNADFIISSIEIGQRFDLWWQDYQIPRKHGSTQVLGECGGPGGSFHAWRIIPQIIEIIKDVERICPSAFFINFSNPMARVCLAIKRTSNIKFVGLCHEIGSMNYHLPKLLKIPLENLKISVAGLNHFGFLIDLANNKTGENLMKRFNSKAMSYFKPKQDPWQFYKLTFQIYKKFHYFPYTSDSHIGEYLQFASEFINPKHMVNWIRRTDKFGQAIYRRILRYHRRLKEGKYPRRGMLLKVPSGERAIPIIEAILKDQNSYEPAVNIPNDGIIENLPQDLVVEVPITVDKQGVHGVKIGAIPKQLATILRIEASVQDLCVEAILKESKELAIASLAVDPNVGSFEKAEKMFTEMIELQKEYLPNFK